MIRGRSWGRRRRSSTPVFDNSALSPNNANGAQSVSLLVGGSGPKTVLAALSHLNPNAGNPTPVTCGGVPMTFVGKAGAGQSYLALFRLDGVTPSSTPYAIALSTGENYSIAGAVSYGGVASSAAAPVLAQGTAGPASTGALAVAGNEILVSFLSTRLTPTVTSGTVRAINNHTSGFNFMRIIEGAGNSPQTNSATTSNSYAMVSVKLAG